LCTFFTYATVALIALFIVWWAMERFSRRTLLLLVSAAVTFVASFALLYLLTGCSIIACARASVAFDRKTMSQVQAHYWDVSATNLLGFLVGSGFIAATLWMRSTARQARFATLSRALGITIVVLSFSTLFTRELERVWMFLTPLLLIGAAGELEQGEPQVLRKRWTLATLVLLFAQTWLTQLLLYTIW
jgi:hypothetical protein